MIQLRDFCDVILTHSLPATWGWMQTIAKVSASSSVDLKVRHYSAFSVSVKCRATAPICHRLDGVNISPKWNRVDIICALNWHPKDNARGWEFCRQHLEDITASSYHIRFCHRPQYRFALDGHITKWILRVEIVGTCIDGNQIKVPIYITSNKGVCLIAQITNRPRRC